MHVEAGGQRQVSFSAMSSKFLKTGPLIAPGALLPGLIQGSTCLPFSCPGITDLRAATRGMNSVNQIQILMFVFKAMTH